MKKITVLIILLSALSVSAQFNKAGRTAFQFLKIGTGARAAALGEATIANINNANAAFWNPAALTRVRSGELALNYNKWIGDLNVLSSSLAVQVQGVGVIGVNVITLDYGDLEEAYVTSQSGGIDSRTGNTFTGSDLSLGLSLARAFTDKLSIGANVKYLREKLYTYSSDVWAFDIGSFYDTGWKGIRIAMCAQNFSGSARWLETKEEEQQSYDLPLLFRLGFSMDVLGRNDLVFGGNPETQSLTLNVDAVHSNDYKERLNIGAEYNILDMVFLRGGYRFNYDEGNLSGGIGLHYDTGFFDFRFDYAYIDYDFLDVSHRFSLILAL